MRRARLTILALVSATALPGAVAAQGAPPHAVLRQLVCQRALDPAARAVNVTAVMRPVPGTEHMAIAFSLLQRPAGAAGFTTVSGSGLGAWVSPSDPTVGQRAGDVWIAKHPVADLLAPAAYRYSVSFRWTGAGGKVLGTATRLSRVCVEPELRPDLVVQRVSVTADPNHPKTLDDYAVTLANIGATTAGPFTLRLSSGAVVKDKPVDKLGAHRTRTFAFVGPICDSGSPPVITADPAGQVDVSSRAGATYAVSCPAPPSTGSGAAAG